MITPKTSMPSNKKFKIVFNVTKAKGDVEEAVDAAVTRAVSITRPLYSISEKTKKRITYNEDIINEVSLQRV